MRTLAAFLLWIAQVSSAQPEGWFLGNPWGTSLSRLQQKHALREITKTQERVTYASDIRQLGHADLDECNLEFVDGRFSGVTVTTKGEENSTHLLKYLRRMFGEGRSPNPPAITWVMETTRICYDIDSAGDAYVYWYSLIHQEQ
jgi:hypothetical protein